MDEPRRLAPVELGSAPASSLCLAPEHPRREDAIEQRLDERRTEEVLSFFPLEFEAEPLFEGRAYACEGEEIRVLDPRPGVARVGSEEPRDLTGLREGGSA